jgi:hypothetical protein
MTRWLGQLLGVVLTLAGLVWLGQGLGFIRGSFMTGSPLWAVIGAACLLAGGTLLWRTIRHSRRP